MEAKRNRNDVAIQRLVNNHKRFLSFLTRRVGDPSDAEEILQTAYVKSVKQSDKIRNGETIVAWFYRLLQNALIDYYRHKGAEHRALKRFADNITDEGAPSQDLERVVCQCFKDLLPLLKDEYSELLRRVDLEGQSISDISREKKITPNNTRVKLHRARIALRKQLEISCGSCAEHACLDCDCKHTH
jgi:RNA polymerase sigma-70 factor (ECF subfamily)